MEPGGRRRLTMRAAPARPSSRLPAAVLVFLLVASGARPPRLPEELAEWPHGAVRWLLLPEEAAAFARLDRAEDARAFIAAFWARRDPAPGGPVNAFAQQFFERSAMADKLYAEEDVRGSLSDRGGALILLGPPPVLRVLRRKVPALDAGRPGRAGGVLEVPVEIWAYQPADLPEVVRLEPRLASGEITVTFRAGAHASILDGRSVLRLAARAAVHGEPP